MSGHTIATAHWRALDREGEDTCRLSQVDHGWCLIGHARFRDTDGFTALDYVVRCDPSWLSLGADVAGRHGAQDVSIKLERRDDHWVLNDEEQPQVRGASDVDLAFTPATNLMPLRRLLKTADKALTTCSAWLTFPAWDLRRLDQSYDAGEALETVNYAAEQTEYATQLCFDRSGFVTLYPGLWEGEVTHAST